MKKKSNAAKTKKPKIQKRELAMVEGILEGSPDGIGVVIVRIDCGCRKMAAIAKDGEPASKVIIYRDDAESICEKCKDDGGSYMRVKETFIHWVQPEPSVEDKRKIETKVMGAPSTH